MSQITASNISSHTEDEIDIRAILNALWKSKLLITCITAFFTIIGIIYSLSLPNLYKAEALLSPVEQNSTSQSVQSFGGLATLAGINLPQSNGGKDAKALEKLKSLSFFSDHILPNISLPDLMAVEFWDSVNNTVVYDKNLYSESTKSWVRKHKHPKSLIPSAQESYKVFKKIVQISSNEDTGFVTISVKHHSPYIAKEWTELIVTELNNFFRTNDKLEAQASMDYLDIQIAQTSYTEIRQVIAALIEQKMQQMTLVEANPFYVFSYIDPPTVMEEKFEPKRTSITILGSIIGLFLGILLVLTREFFKNNQS